MRRKTTQQIMDSKATIRASGYGVSVPKYPTAYRCFSMQNSSSSQQDGKAKIFCNNCQRDFLVPTCTNNFYCPTCQTNNAPKQEQGQSSGRKRRHRLKICGFICNDRVDRGRRKGNVIDQKPYLSAESSLSMSRRFNKRAVLCGVTYEKRKFRLKGTVNDVRNMKIMLTDIFGFSNEAIRVLTGHGLQQPDLKEDEIDGFDETICPVDFLREGMIVDNDINSIIVHPLKEGVELHAIVDACHSGTILDLTHVYNREKCIWEDNTPPAKEPIRKHTSGGLAICLGACGDSQTAADTTAFGGKGMNGVMTFLLTKIVKENPGITYGKLLEKMHDEIEKVIQRRCKPSFLRHIFPQNISQDPILSSSAKFNVYEKRFVL